MPPPRFVRQNLPDWPCEMPQAESLPIHTRSARMRRSRRSSRSGVVLIVVVVVIVLVSLSAYSFVAQQEAEHRGSRLEADRMQSIAMTRSGQAAMSAVFQLSRAERTAYGGLQQNEWLCGGLVVDARDPARLGRFFVISPRSTTVVSAFGETSDMSQAEASASSRDFAPSSDADSKPWNASASMDGSFAANEDLPLSSLRHTSSSGNASGRSLVDALEPASSPATSNAVAYRFGCENESAKLHLAALLEWETTHPGAARWALLQLPGMDESTADAILDWVDADDQTREFGAEREYYQSLVPPRTPANRATIHLDSLLSVRGVTADKLYGRDRDFDYIDDSPQPTLAMDSTNGSLNATSSRLPSGTATATPGPAAGVSPTGSTLAQPVGGGSLDGTAAGVTGAMSSLLAAPWTRYLTTTSAERNRDYRGRPRIMLNDANLAELHRQLRERFDDATANFVIALRQFGPAIATAAGSEMAADTFTPDITRQAKFELGGLAELLQIRVDVGTTESPKLLTNPFGHSEQWSEHLVRFFDAATVTADDVLVGRVNLDEGEREVLLAIPTMDAATVDAILVNRQKTMNANGNANLSSLGRVDPVWLVAEQLLSPERYRQIEPYVTLGGDVFQAQIVGGYGVDAPTHRAWVMWDATEMHTKQIYYADLSRWGLGEHLRGLWPAGPLNSSTFPPALNAKSAQRPE